MKQAQFLKNLPPFLLLAGLLAFLMSYQLGDWTRLYIKYLFDLGHVPLFGLGSLCILNIVKRSKGDTLRAYCLAGIISGLLGLATEIIQIWEPRRYFQVTDLLRNVVGVVSFLAFHYLLFHREAGRKIKWGIVAVLTLCTVIVSVPFARAALDQYFMYVDFPVIGSFEREAELDRWWAPHAELARTTSHATQGKYSLEVRLSPETYLGIGTQEMIRNWKGYEALLMDIFLQGDEPMPLTIRINDTAHHEEYQDRYNQRFELQPGPNQIRVPLEEVFNAPKTRTMVRESIGLLRIFSPDLKAPRTFNIDNIRLSK